MTDEFDTLRAALKSAPAADPEARARALALAMANFDRLQRAGGGFLAPGATNENEEGWDLNRRVELVKGPGKY